jgi:hypothetical protein
MLPKNETDTHPDFVHSGVLMVLYAFVSYVFNGARVWVWQQEMFCCSVAGPMLFSFICKQDDEYKEVTVCHYMRQLMSALSYLHCQGIAHLDVKVSFLKLICMCIFVLCGLKENIILSFYFTFSLSYSV